MVTYVVHAYAHRPLRYPVQGTVRSCPLRHARLGGRRRPGRLRGLAGAVSDLAGGFSRVPDASAGRTASRPARLATGHGEGNLAMNAPNLAGLPGWYIARQLAELHPRYTRRRAGDPMAGRWGRSRSPSTMPRFTRSSPTSRPSPTPAGHAARRHGGGSVLRYLRVPATARRAMASGPACPAARRPGRLVSHAPAARVLGPDCAAGIRATTTGTRWC